MSDEAQRNQEASAEPAAGPQGNPDLPGKIVETIKTIFDPEIPVNIYDLGLIYEIDVDDDAHVSIKMTLTSPACPVAGSLPPEVQQKVAEVEGVRGVDVDVVWDPPWDKEMMSDEVKLQLGLL